MFNFLKDKLKSWLGKPQEPKVKEKKVVKAKKNKKKVVKQKREGKDSHQVVGVEEPLKPAEEVKHRGEKRGFFTTLFGKGGQPQEPKKEKQEVIESTTVIEVQREEKSFFAKLAAKFTTAKITSEEVEEIFTELELILLESNVALEVVDNIKETMMVELVNKEIKSGELESRVIESIKKAIEGVLIDPPNLVQEIKNHSGTYTIIFFGINGSGKTTSIAKLAHKLKKEGISVCLAAADTFRAAAVEQLEIHAGRLGVPIIKSQYGSDPTSVAFDAKAYAEKNNIKCLLIDTAGRMYTKENLIKQMEKIIRVIQPNKKIFVGESTTGNDMIDQARTFNEVVGIDGIILSKADVDEKGGTALSASYVTQKPIYFLGTGQEYDDLEEFNKEKIIKTLGLE